MLLHVKSGLSSTNSLKFCFLFAEVKLMLFDGVEDKNPKAAGWREKYQINLDTDILVDRGRRCKKGPSLAP